ncbi:MAG: DUF5667 domain-containing protein [Candidatus Brachytrichaceae bacterium NZ_4S206]
MRDEFARKPARGVWGWLSELIKRCLGIGRSGDEVPASSLHTPLRQVSASLVPGLMATFASMTIVIVAQNSLPNQALYPVKLWSEDVQLSLTVEPESRLTLLIKFINCRVSELNALHQRGESPSPAFMLRLETQVNEALQLLNARSGPDAYDAATVRALERLRATAIAPSPFVISPDRVLQNSVPLPMTPTVAPTGTPGDTVVLTGVVGNVSGVPAVPVTETQSSGTVVAAPSPTFTPVPSAPLVTLATVEANPTAQANDKAARDAIQIDSVDVGASLPTAVAVTVPAPSMGMTPQPIHIVPTPTLVPVVPTPVHVVPTPQPTALLQPTPTPVHVVPTPQPTALPQPTPTPQPTALPQPTPTPVHIVPTPQPTVVPQPTPTPVHVVPTPQPTALPQPTPTPQPQPTSFAPVPIPIVPPTVKPAPPLLPVEPIAPPALPIDTPAAPMLPILPTAMNPVPAPIFSLENPEAIATPLPDESVRATAPPTMGPMPDQTQQQGEPSGNK